MAAKRYIFIDLFRGWAVIFMVETHVVNAWMNAELRSSGWFSYLNLLNGFVAPSFLFIAGVSFAIVARMKWPEMTTWSKPVVRQIRRLLMILGIGYFLHLPRIQWEGLLPRFVADDLPGFYQADILHTIAVSLLILQFLALLFRSQRPFLIGLTLMTTLALFSTPMLWQHEFSLHPLIANYLNGLNNPLFPLFPWCVFLFSGALVGFYFLNAAERDHANSAIKWIVIAGAVLFTSGFVADRIPFSLFTYENFWLTSPNWVLMRLGILFLIFAGFWFLEERGLHTSPKVLVIGSQSLFAYVIHLWLIYSITGDKASVSLLDQTNPVWLTAILLAVLLTAVYFLTVAWAAIKRYLKTRLRSAT